MKLSELVRYRNNLEAITHPNPISGLEAILNPMIHAVETNEMQMPHFTQKLKTDRDNISQSVQSFQDTFTAVKAEVDLAIEAMEPTYLANSYRLYEAMQVQDTPEYILDRRLNLPPAVQNYILSRVQLYSNWKHTGGILRSGLESWIDHMVAFDPLYVVDTDHALLDPVKSRFNEQYANRLRFYVVDESRELEILRDLPNNQFGIFLAYNFFHYKPFDLMRQYLTEIYDKLDSGGCLLFTFNDCDRWGAVDLSERNFMCYTPGRLIRGLCQNLGYEIINSYVIDNATTWLEIRKPGVHRTIKGGQTLARVVVKSK